MSGFYQTGVVRTLHRFGTKSLEAMKADLIQLKCNDAAQAPGEGSQIVLHTKRDARTFGLGGKRR